MFSSSENDGKPIFEPFDLRIAKKPNMKFITRDGRSVRIICWNALTEDADPIPCINNEQPIIALVMDKDGETEEIVTYNECGTRGHAMDFYDWELLMYFDDSEALIKTLKPKLYKAKRSYDKKEIVGQLVWIEGKIHLIRDCDIEEDGHHFAQASDEPTWIDEETIEEIGEE